MSEQNGEIERIVAKLGEKIKAVRTEKGWSLKALSNRSGISAAAIHKIESNGITPTITTMMKISDALGKKISNFVEEEPGEKDVCLINSNERKPVFTFKKGLDLQGISAKQYGEFIMTAAYATVEVGASSGKKSMSYRGEELVYCLQGKMRFEVKKKIYDLSPGDSLHFRTHLEHKWENLGEIPARLLWVVSIEAS
ncbi:MAG: cupin domain-containing protein [Candidatus Dadabacteria bacterium]|nr:cupin domain-containing protein [Candidatus Dadabacteria bacterium]MCY4261924.1 cupin domain-containing protein [Candidatus Dadabacteria bacterium]